MCNFRTLHHSKFGYVLQCDKCNHIQTAFGNICIAQSEEKFSQLLNAVGEYYNDKQFDDSRDSKTIYLQTPAQNMNLVMTVNELEKLNDMLQQANLLFEAEKILCEHH